MIRKRNIMLQVSVPKEIVESMNEVVKTISKKLKIHYTKGMLVSDIYAQWLTYQNQEIQAATEKAKEE